MDDATRFGAAHAGGTVDAPLAATLADALVGLTLQLGDLAYDLGTDPETLRRHVTSLQAVDAVTQGLLAVADILRSDAPVAARFDAVTLHSLAQSLHQRYREACAAALPD